LCAKKSGGRQQIHQSKELARRFNAVASLPKTEATLRVQKAELRQHPLYENAWHREAAGVSVLKCRSSHRASVAREIDLSP
jgi:hypothetical protein